MSIQVNDGTWKITIIKPSNGPSLTVSNATTSGFSCTLGGGNSQAVTETNNAVSLNGPGNQVFNGTVNSSSNMSGTVAGLEGDVATWEADFVPPPPETEDPK